jgi:integrase
VATERSPRGPPVPILWVQQALDSYLASRGTNHGLVFPNTMGKPLHPSQRSATQVLSAARASGLPRIRFPDLRHSSATLLLGLGIHPKIVSEMLGHSQIAITLDLYSHVTATMQQEAVRAFEGLFAVR